MDKFEQSKDKKLKRLIGLRVMNAIGMIAWRNDSYGEAAQYLRLVHPVTWVWMLIMILYSVLAQGIPSTIADITYTVQKESVWWK